MLQACPLQIAAPGMSQDAERTEGFAVLPSLCGGTLEVVQGKGLKPEQRAAGKNEFCKRAVKLTSLVAPNGRVAPQMEVGAVLLVH